MSPTASEPKKDTTTLEPHQAAFVNTVLSSTSRHTVWLLADVGFGKTKAMAAAAARLIRERTDAQVLVLCPAALRLQWVEMLKQEGTPGWIIDRYRFREILDSSGFNELWPCGGAAILSDDFAKQPDIRHSLASVHWDLVIADEAHRFSGSRAELLKAIAVNAARIVLASVPGMTPPMGFSLENATVVEWRHNEIVDDKGELLNAPPVPLVLEVRFAQNEGERHLSKTIKALCDVLGGTHPQRIVSSALVRSLHSSPAALEGILRRLIVGPEKNDEIDVGPSDDDWGEAPQPIEPHAAEKGRSIAGQALQTLESIQVDSKLIAFGTLVADLAHAEAASKQICVLTDYLSTLYYLAAEIEEHDIPFALIYGSMAMDARHDALESFENAGGILLATRAVISEGLDLRDITDLVLYDVPLSRSALHRVIGRFNRFGRNGRLTIHAFAPEDGSDAVEFDPIRVLLEVDRTQG